MANIRGKVEAVTDFIFLGSKIPVDGDWSHETGRYLLLGRKAKTNLAMCVVVAQLCSTLGDPWTVNHRLLCPWNSSGKNTGVGCHFLLQGICSTQGSNIGLRHCRQMLYHLSQQRREITLPEGPCSQSCGFSSSYVKKWELDQKEGWVPKNWCFLTVVLEKTLDSPLDSKEIKPVNPKGNQPWIFIGRTDAEVEAPILWPPDAKTWLTGKDPDAGKDWGKRRRGNRWGGWMASLTQWTWIWANSRDCEGRGSLAYCSLWVCKELGMT